jgi:ABC-type glycerol-3-phosphate transport system substrate-binding protein
MKIKNIIMILLVITVGITSISCKPDQNTSSDVSIISKTETSMAISVSTESEILSSDLSVTSSEASGVSSGSVISTASAGNSIAASSSNAFSRIISNQKTINRNFTIASGTKKMVDGLNFGGKTLKMLIWTQMDSPQFRQEVKDFESKFNCKVSIDAITHSQFMTKLSTTISAGKPYDIVYNHGSFYPTVVINNVLEPLNPYMTTADLYNPSNINAGGIDIEKSKYYAWDGKLFATSYYRQVNIMVIYYNKKKFQEAELEDPMTLYKKGQWTWEKFNQMGKEVTDPAKNIYFGDASFHYLTIPMANGGHFVKEINGVLSENLKSTELINGLKLMQQMSTGASRIFSNEGSTEWPTNLLAGKVYTWVSEISCYEQKFNDNIKNNNVFGNDYKNLGVVPVPLGLDNKNKEYPASWINGISSSRGSKNPKAAVAFSIFESSYQNSVSAELPSVRRDLATSFDPLYKTVNYMDFGYRDSSDAVNDVAVGICQATSMGRDINELLSGNQKRVQGLINLVLSAQ